MSILVTGGAGFIGANFVIDWLAHNDEPVINLDKLTYAGNLENLAGLQGNERHVFVRGDIGETSLVDRLLAEHRPRAVINFAAESHVDRSIHGPGEFVQTNIVGTFHLLESVRAYWNELESAAKARFRFLHVSTDEVYGSLGKDAPAFSETNRYEPNSPYSASKAASDHLVRAYHHTYGLPVLTTNCSNNYGPYQFPEKLIPLFVTNALIAAGNSGDRALLPKVQNLLSDPSELVRGAAVWAFEQLADSADVQAARADYMMSETAPSVLAEWQQGGPA